MHGRVRRTSRNHVQQRLDELEKARLHFTGYEGWSMQASLKYLIAIIPVTEVEPPDKKAKMGLDCLDERGSAVPMFDKPPFVQVTSQPLGSPLLSFVTAKPMCHGGKTRPRALATVKGNLKPHNRSRFKPKILSAAHCPTWV